MPVPRRAPGWIHTVRRPIRGPVSGVVFLLHGTGGDETSLLELGRAVAPDQLLVGVRGRSLEEGTTRYFRRFNALHYDQAHLASEARDLTAFVRSAADRFGPATLPRSALGYSNGANIALAAELLSPGTFHRLALLRPVQPFEVPPEAELRHLKALLLLGSLDPYRIGGRELPPFLRERGAAVEDRTIEAGHELAPADVASLAAWFGGPPV